MLIEKILSIFLIIVGISAFSSDIEDKVQRYGLGILSCFLGICMLITSFNIFI